MALLDIVGVTVTAVTTPSTLFLLLLASVPLFGIYVAVYTLSRRVPWPANAPPIALDNYPITGSWGFWGRRWSWHRRQRDATPSGNFAFHAGPNTIVGLSGDAGRRLFFESKDLGFGEGYAVLFGQSPTVEALDVGEAKDHDINNHFTRRIVYLLKNEQFRRKLPTLIADTQEAMDAIGNDPSGVTNPFESLYRIVFRLTIRMVGADDIADDAQLLEQTLALFETIEASATATSVMFPKVPSPALLKRTYAGTKLYFLIEGIIKKRTASGEKHDDALQYMLDQGDRTFRIIEFVVGALFAGLLNSGINAAWVACYLACSPEWLAKAQDEVRAAAAKYARDPSAPLRYQLDHVPLEAWESEFPVIDMCLRDSIRLNLLGTAFRKNTSGRPIPTGHGNEVIPPGAFVAYATGDIHLDPQVYPDPLKWDPARYLPDRAEDKKKPDAFVGWGAGRHPCLGVRFAKLEQNIITAYFIASFDFSLEDEKGTKLTTPPQVDVERHSAHKPDPPQFLRVTPKYK
ncbi:Obtusifoliol 14-alpha demethylase [Colletotrichum shisoi]|uniref:Obtusifoliol 14-alpha demethylase n=1 Tax=Colletotrichum shisoi TaxID=2078593 RepID=A0A5Q4BGY9_9PEZI|nr:Obtusifoliol 14-alpha demethylase [Colletotrichum shisoi]